MTGTSRSADKSLDSYNPIPKQHQLGIDTVTKPTIPCVHLVVVSLFFNVPS